MCQSALACTGDSLAGLLERFFVPDGVKTAWELLSGSSP